LEIVLIRVESGPRFVFETINPVSERSLGLTPHFRRTTPIGHDEVQAIRVVSSNVHRRADRRVA
jgi:hypothetical protein